MGHGSQCGNTIDLVRDRTGGSDAAADVCGTCAGHSSRDSLCTTGAEFHHGTALGGTDNTVCFRGDEALVVQCQQNISLDELGLDRGSLYRHKRFHGEDGGSFGDCPDISGKLEVCQIL